MKAKLPKGVSRVLDQWFLDHAGTTAPESLRAQLHIEIQRRINDATTRARSAERKLWNRS
jgi:hypothetical protein